MAQRFFRNIENIIRGAQHFGLIGGNQQKTATDTGVQTGGQNVFNESGIFGPAEQAELEALAAQTGTAASLEFTTGDGIPKVDWRARIRPKNDINSNEYFAGSILEPIRNSGGLVFQYTPSIYVSGAANWNSAQGVGQNYPVWTYNNSTPPSIPIVGTFTANTAAEARYMLAVMHWVRGITKSAFGIDDYSSGKYGTPPPVLVFEYLGEAGFNAVPVIVTSYAYAYAPEVDYVPVDLGGSITYVPVKIELTINTEVAHVPSTAREKFSIERFVNGTAYGDGFI